MVLTVERLKAQQRLGMDTSKKRASVHVGRTNTAILTGQEDLSLWSDEELKRGQRKSSRGRWEGKPPSVVPKAVHDELVKRTLAKANELLRDNLVGAIECLAELMTGADVDDAVRLKAALAIKDHVMGKAPQTIDITATVKPYEEVLESFTIERDVIDVDYTEE